MALFESTTMQPMRYVLRRQRAATYEGVRTGFYIRPMKHREFQRFTTAREMAALGRGLTADEVAGKVSDADEATLRDVLSRADNFFKDGDDVTDPAEIVRGIEQLGWLDLQELLVAARDRSVLEEGAKNS